VRCATIWCRHSATPASASKCSGTEVLSRSSRTTAATVENIVGRRPGAGPLGKALVLMSHYDSVPHAPGAADDGVGVAAKSSKRSG